MVCTGDTLIFGIQMELSEVVKYMLRYLKKNTSKASYKACRELFEENSDNKNETFEQLEELFEELKLSIDIIRPTCCLWKIKGFSHVYLGVELCSNDHLVSPFDTKPKKFSTIEDYEKFYISELTKAKEELQANKQTYIEHISRIVPESHLKLGFYTLPNDCYRCT